MRQYCHHLAGLLPIGLKVWNLISFLFFWVHSSTCPPIKMWVGNHVFFWLWVKLKLWPSNNSPKKTVELVSLVWRLRDFHEAFFDALGHASCAVWGPSWWGKCRFPRILGLGILFVPQGLYIFLVPVVPIGFASFWIWDSHKLQGKN